MPKFRVHGIFTATKYLGEFEAETKVDAMDQAGNCEENRVGLCHQCAGELDLDENSASQFIVEEVEE